MQVKLLKAEMVKQGKTQADLAKTLGISQNSMNRKMNGISEFKISEVVKLCEYLCISDPVGIFLR